MIEFLLPGLYRIFVPLPDSPLKNINSYFIRGKDRSLLIDTGFNHPVCKEALEQGLAELGADRDRLDFFITHLHSDHAGLAPALVSRDSRIFVGRVDGAVLQAGFSARHWDALDRMYLAEGFPEDQLAGLNQKNPGRALAPDPSDRYILLEEDAVLAYGGYRLRCIDTAGHTPGHMCLYEPEREVLFSGDHVLFDITPNIVRWTTMKSSLHTFCANLEKLRSLPVQMTLPAHRSADGTLVRRIDQLLAHHQARLDHCLRSVREHPGQSAFFYAGTLPWSIRCRDWASFPLVQKWFAVGETLAHLTWLEQESLLRRVEENNRIFYEVI